MQQNAIIQASRMSSAPFRRSSSPQEERQSVIKATKYFTVTFRINKWCSRAEVIICPKKTAPGRPWRGRNQLKKAVLEVTSRGRGGNIRLSIQIRRNRFPWVANIIFTSFGKHILFAVAVVCNTFLCPLAGWLQVAVFKYDFSFHWESFIRCGPGKWYFV